jgi:hypothetical protein
MKYGEIMDRWVKIIIGDSRKMPEIDDESVDLTSFQQEVSNL